MKRLMTFLMLLVALTMATSACGTKRRKLEANPSFSINVIPVPRDWPDESKRDWASDPVLASQQQAVYEQHGPPDFFRVLWSRDGRLMTQREMNARAWMDRKQKQSKEAPDFEWIYLDKKVTYRFRKGSPTKGVLKDNIRIVTEYGDPQEIKDSMDVSRAPVQIYQYYDRGKVFYFRDGDLYKEENQTPMPGMGMRR